MIQFFYFVDINRFLFVKSINITFLKSSRNKNTIYSRNLK